MQYEHQKPILTLSSIIPERAKRGGRNPRTVAPPVKGEPSAVTTAPAKRGPGRPRKEVKAVPRRSIIQPDEVDLLATGAPSVSTAPPMKRGPGRPRKNAPITAPAPRRSIVQPDENPLLTGKPSKKRPASLSESQDIPKAPVAHGKKNMKTVDPLLDSPERPKKRQRRGLTNIYSSPISSSISPAAAATELESGLDRPRHVYESETSQQTAQSSQNTIRVQAPKRRIIVQPDE